MENLPKPLLPHQLLLLHRLQLLPLKLLLHRLLPLLPLKLLLHRLLLLQLLLRLQSTKQYAS